METATHTAEAREGGHGAGKELIPSAITLAELTFPLSLSPPSHTQHSLSLSALVLPTSLDPDGQAADRCCLNQVCV